MHCNKNKLGMELKAATTQRLSINPTWGGRKNYITILTEEDQCWAPSVLSLSGNHLLRTSRGIIFPIIYHITSIWGSCSLPLENCGTGEAKEISLRAQFVH